MAKVGILFVAAAISFVGGLAGCAKSQQQPPPRTAKRPVARAPAPAPAPLRPPLCVGESFFEADRPPKDRKLPAEFWFGLLVKGYQPSGDFARPARDCRGARATLDLDSCAGQGAPAHRTALRSLRERDLVVTPISDSRRLVWVMTDLLSDGQAEGPIAIAEIDRSVIAIRALGVLRAYPTSATLTLQKFRDGVVLIADGLSCDDNQPPDGCARSARLLPLIDDAFSPKTMVDENGNCVGSASVQLRANGTSWNRRDPVRFRLSSSMSFTADGLDIREELTLQKKSARGTPDGAYVMRQQAQRHVTVDGGNLIANGPSLLARWREANDVGDPARR